MSTSFSIDDVRDSFKTDVGAFLTRIERGANAALATPALKSDVLKPEGRPAFTALGDLAHAIYGTSALVGAESLNESARIIEKLARAGEEAVVAMEIAAARARAIATACAEGVKVMRQALVSELDRRGASAVVVAQRWIEGVSDLLPSDEPAAATASAPESVNAPAGADVDQNWDPDSFRVPSPITSSLGSTATATATATAPPEAPASDEPVIETMANEVFQFATTVEELQVAERAAQEPSAESVFQFEEPEEPADGFGGELLQIFRTEGQETVRGLSTALVQLGGDPGDMAAVANLERLYHTMKGAASIVGLDEVGRAAADIQERLEGQLESGSALTAEAVAALVTETEAMLQLAGLPSLAASSPEPADAPAEPAPAADDAITARRFFVEEVQELERESHALLEELGSSSAEASHRARLELATLFHRLKGSALLVGETQVGAEAEKMQHLFDPEGTGSTAAEDLAPAARSALARIATMLGTEVQPSAAAAPAPAAPAPVREPVTVTAEPELWDAFTQESGLLIEGLERESLALEETAQPRQVLEKVMNLLHTLKGVLNTVGLAPTAKELHRVEDFVEALLKNPILPPMRSVANLLLKVKADVHRNLGEAKHGYVETSMARLEARIAKVLVAARGKVDAPASGTQGTSVIGALAGTAGASVHSISRARSARNSTSSSQPSEVVAASPRDAASDLLDRKVIRVGTERLDSLMNLAGELVVARSRLLDRVGTMRHLQRELGRGSVRLVDVVDEFRNTYEYFNIDGRGNVAPRRQPSEEPQAALWESFGELELDRYEDIHILSRRLAEIVSDVNELSGQLSRSLTTFNDDSRAFDAIVSGIQSEVSRARMVQLDLLFTRLRLPVREAAGREQKEVRVVSEGAEVSIDKTIADGLFSPMLHLVRNCVVHGIESAEVRQAAGKSAVGTITLAARQESGQIVLEVQDDGAGLDLQALRATGVRLGLVAEDTPLSDPAIKDLVFVPGLTTREQAGAVSGRGVGCDVVRRAVERMNGTIQVETEAGHGARFIITLPVTLAITKALLVRANQRTYALPLHFAERIIDVSEEPIVESAGARRIKIDDAFATITHIEQHLGASGGAATGPVLVLRVGEQREVLQVDAVIGQEEIVVKSLGDILAGHPLFAGVTMRGSGELVLILDVPGLMEIKAARRERTGGLAAAGRAGRGRAGIGAAAPSPARRRRARVLFVDDSLSVRKYAELTFAALGVDVTLAVDGIDALAQLRKERFDMVFTDLEMPRMHGFELIRELRFLPAYQNLPVVVVSSRSGQKHKQQAKALGASDYLTKPFSADVLAAVLRRFIGADEVHVAPAPQGAPS